MPGAGARPRANRVGVAPCRADDGAGAVPSHFCVPGPAFSLWGGRPELGDPVLQFSFAGPGTQTWRVSWPIPDYLNPRNAQVEKTCSLGWPSVSFQGLNPLSLLDTQKKGGPVPLLTLRTGLPSSVYRSCPFPAVRFPRPCEDLFQKCCSGQYFFFTWRHRQSRSLETLGTAPYFMSLHLCTCGFPA